MTTVQCEICGVAFKVGDHVKFRMWGKDRDEPLVSGVHTDCLKKGSKN